MFQLWSEVKSSLLCTSSPESDPTKFNFFEILMNSPDFRTEIVSEICEYCIDIGKRKCVHNFKFKSSTKADEKKRKIESIIPEEHIKTFEAESYARVNHSRSKFFNPLEIDRFVGNDVDISQAKIKKIIVSVDPSGGTSDTLGICAIAECFTELHGNTYAVYYYYFY